MPIDPRELRTCLGRFATGVTVVSCLADGQPHGVTVSSFTSVSLDPPLVLVSLGRATRACGFLPGRPFTVNVLRADQDDLARRFAGQPSSSPVVWEPAAGGLAPRLADALAYLACTPWQSVEAGDHVLYLGEVREFADHGGEPLVFYRGSFRDLGSAAEPVPWLESLDCPSSLGFSLSSPARVIW